MKIEITISPKGDSTVETKGFSGNQCREASKSVEEALGTQAAERMTAEFYQTEQTKQNNQQPA